jgi:peptidoglycan-N-acetylglucosamine deacetylase
MYGLYFIGIMLIAAILSYTLIPDLFLHYWGLGTWKRQYTPGVALTFDDGPNPEVTPQLLDILDHHQVKATFFIVGQRAELYPDLVKLIHTRGHKLGAHSHSHRFAWFLSPGRTLREWDRCVATLEKLTGETVNWIRPPWGTFNLAAWWWLKKHQKQAILWSVEGHDWIVRYRPEQIVERILNRTHDGSIVLLHDAGGAPGSPQNTLDALDTICTRIVQEKKLPLVEMKLPTWSWPHRLVFGIWSAWERLFAYLYNIERISSTNVFRLSKISYKGPELYLPDGQLIVQAGDLVGEIHFDSSRMYYEADNPREKGIHILKVVRSSLPELARFVADNPEYDKISAFTGLTLINQGVKRFGFQVQEVPPTVFTRWLGKYQQLIMKIYHNSSSRSLKQKYSSQPRLVWMSRQQLMENWL